MIKPWGTYIAVTDPPTEAQDGTYKGTGIVIPEGFGHDILDRGIVLGVGPEVNEPDGFEEGAMIWFPHGAGSVVGERADAIKFVDRRQVIAWEAALDRDGSPV